MIQHINRGERGNPIRVKLNEVIDFVNAHVDETGGGDSAALLSARVWFALNTLNPSTPDIDIQLFADYGHLRWRIRGDIYDANIGSWYGLVIDAFDGADGESRIDVVYAIIPTDLDDHTTGIKVRKGTNSTTPSAPALNEDEVYLGYIYLNVSGYVSSEGSGTDKAVVVDGSRDVGGQQEVDGKKHFRNRLLMYQPATDLASANNLILSNGRFFRLSDAVNELQTINNNGWTGGTDILLEIKPGQAIKHNAADYGLGHYNGILLAVQADYTATQDIILMLVWDSVVRKWKEVGATSVAMVSESSTTRELCFFNTDDVLMTYHPVPETINAVNAAGINLASIQYSLNNSTWITVATPLVISQNYVYWRITAFVSNPIGVVYLEGKIN